ncbi:PREDICTED: ABC transporter C family member 10 [Camelina sativa]|uniref:ABC-type xenobiotic transporter n=1 Tax=Camelina sativa TaxID=90675 RepID=A0ABM0Z928_CAMSA|nr:PREDICTED: ABC transporter C family member 10 [Camelina sativa]
MIENFWTWFCENHHQTSSNCTLRLLQICFGITLSALTLFISLFLKESPKNNYRFHCLRIVSPVFNVIIGSLDLILAISVLRENHDKPLIFWLVVLIQGFTWLLINLVVCVRGTKIRKSSLRLLSIFSFFYALVSSCLAVNNALSGEEVSIRTVLDVLLLPGSVLLLLSAYKGYRFEESGESSLYEPLNAGDHSNGFNEKSDFDHRVSQFAKAGLFSKLSFWWLNSLIKRGNVKDLEEEDIPELRNDERAKTCYSLFEENLNEQKRRLGNSCRRPSILKVTFSCVSKELLISGCFAFMKIVAVSAGPLLLNAFILVAEGNARFRYEGLVLAVLLFFSKMIESLSQRQWYFRCRLVGLRVRSSLTAAINKKQLRLNNSSRLIHSGSEIMNYATVDAYRIGEFPYWFHQLWTTSFQLLIALGILFHSVGVATFSALAVIILTVLCNAPIAKLQNKFQSELMTSQDERLKACNESLVNMKVLKLYAWESHFKKVIEKLRNTELKSLKAVQMRKAYNAVLFWSSPVFVSAATFATCYFLNIPLRASNVFTFVATLRLVQDPVRMIPDVIGVTIQAKVAFSRIATFLEAPELQGGESRRKQRSEGEQNAIVIKSASFSWEEKGSTKPNLRNVSLEVKFGEKVAVCGEVGSGKSTLLAAILGETPCVSGKIDFYGTIAYVSQTAWIQTGTIRDNILFGGVMDEQRYRETIRKSSLDKDLELLPDGDQTEIGERGVNLSGGQKQRIQLARALYQDADIYLLDDPFSAVDAHTASSLFQEYVMDALAGKAVLLVTHQVDFLPAFDSVLLMSDGEIIEADTYQELLARSRDFQDLVNAHRETAGSERVLTVDNPSKPVKEINRVLSSQSKVLKPSRLIKQEEREKGDTGLRPYIQYMNQNKGYIFFFIASLSQVTFAIGQILQNSWMAANVDNPQVSTLKLILVYLLIGLCSVLCLMVRSVCVVIMCMKSSASLFSQLLNSLFRAPMSFYDSTPLGRILSRVSSDLSIVDLDVPFGLIFVVASTVNTGCSLGVLAIVTWQVLFVSVPMVYLAFRLQKYYFQTAKELMRINGTTRSYVANHLAESVAGAITIRAFDEEERFFKKSLTLIDTNASPFFHSFAANEWLIQRLETVSAIVLASTAFCMVLLPTGTFSSGFIGMALSYGLSLNMGLVYSVQNQCYLANWIISVERLKQYTNLTPEAPEVIEETRPPVNWPVTGRVEITDLQIRYRRESPLVLKGISCIFEGGHKIGIVGRTGSGKTTLISALFRLVEPVGGKIVVDGVDISRIGVHDLRSRFGIIPQDPTLFNGTVRFNMDPLCQHSDAEIWEVLGKCQLREVVQEKENGLDSLVVEDGSNWSMGQRQLFCLGRAVLRRSRVLVLDEATASIDNATDLILQKTIRREFADCTVITVAHRIPTVMDCTMVLSISDGRIVEYDEPMKLMKDENSLFGKLVKEYWSHYNSADSR